MSSLPVRTRRGMAQRQFEEENVARRRANAITWVTKRLLRAEMTRRGVTYEDLSERLAAIGINDTAVNIRNKVARGRFSATFLVQCLTALGARALRLGEDIDGQ